MPHEATPKIAVLLDVVPHKIGSELENIIVILYHMAMLLRLAFFENNAAPNGFNDFCSRWISIFDAPVYVIVDRRSDLSAKYMMIKLHDVE